MENVQNYLMAMMAQGTLPGTKPAKPAGQKDDSFGALLREDQAAQKPVDKKPADKKPADKKPVEEKTDAKPEAAAEPKDTETMETAPVEQQMLLAAMASMAVPAPVIVEAEMPEPELQIGAVVLEGQAAEEMSAGPQLLTQETAVPTVEGEAAAPAAPQQTAELHKEPELAEPKTTAEAPKQQLEMEDTDVSVKTASAMEAPEQPLFKEVETVPIKVGDAPKEEPADAAPVHSQVSDRVMEGLKQGESRIELELEPRTLGKVAIEMTMQKDGTIHVLLRAEKPSTQLLLDSDAGKLQSILGRDTRQEVFVETVNYQEKQQMPQYHQDPQDQGQGRQQQEEEHPHHPRHHEEGGEDFLHQLRLGLAPIYGE